jgi:hypothetical protein
MNDVLNESALSYRQRVEAASLRLDGKREFLQSFRGGTGDGYEGRNCFSK